MEHFPESCAVSLRTASHARLQQSGDQHSEISGKEERLVRSDSFGIAGKGRRDR